jgi:hypothetical protein
VFAFQLVVNFVTLFTSRNSPPSSRIRSRPEICAGMLAIS